MYGVCNMRTVHDVRLCIIRSSTVVLHSLCFVYFTFFAAGSCRGRMASPVNGAVKRTRDDRGLDPLLEGEFV